MKLGFGNDFMIRCGCKKKIQKRVGVRDESMIWGGMKKEEEGSEGVDSAAEERLVITEISREMRGHLYPL